MINKERYSFIFLAILAMLDQLIASLFGVDFTYSSLSLVSHLCFCGCLLVVVHERSLNRFLYACLCGLCVGMFFTSDWLVKMLLFGLFGMFSFFVLFYRLFVYKINYIYSYIPFVISMFLYGITESIYVRPHFISFVFWYLIINPDRVLTHQKEKHLV